MGDPTPRTAQAQWKRCCGVHPNSYFLDSAHPLNIEALVASCAHTPSVRMSSGISVQKLGGVSKVHVFGWTPIAFEPLDSLGTPQCCRTKSVSTHQAWPKVKGLGLGKGVC